jgi:DNA-binding transcriptional LysR family regulator
MILMQNGLKAFKAIVECGTVHSAADLLGLTQTAVTQRLKALERDLGLTLFLRSRRGMSLTAEGQSLLQYCRAVEDLEGDFLSSISGDQRQDVELTVVGPTSAISTRVVENCQEIYTAFPHLRLHLISNDDALRVDLVRRGLADMAIVPPEQVPNEMDSKVLRPDRYLLVACARWKGRRLSEILETERIIDFYESDTTTQKYLRQFNLLSSVGRERIFVNENQALIRLFSEGLGYGTLTESVAKESLSRGDLIVLNKGRALEDPLALTWYPRTQKSDYFQAVVRTIR